MSLDERVAFEGEPHQIDAVGLRGWDDAGKIEGGLDIAPFESYLDLLASLST